MMCVILSLVDVQFKVDYICTSLLYTIHDVIMLCVYTCIYRSSKDKTVLYSY